MKALRLLEIGSATVADVDAPRPACDEVLIRVERAGVCGTDREILSGQFPSQLPVTMGHEYAGVIAEVGADVQGLEVGQRVSSPGGWACNECDECRAGRWTFCSDRRVLGSAVNGAFAEYVAVPGSVVIPLPDGVDADEGQSLVAVASCLRGVRRVSQSYARSVAVIGPGHLGLLLVQLLRRMLGGSVVLFGTREKRLEIGSRLGAKPVNVRTTDWTALRSSFAVVFEAAGTPSSLSQALTLVAPGGTVCVLGITPTRTELAPSVLYEKELTVLGSRGGSGEYLEAVRLIQSGAVSAKPLITHRFGIHEADQALVTACKRASNPIRVVIEC